MPDLAIVPKFFTKSFLVIPTPVSVIVRVRLTGSARTVIFNSRFSPNTLASFKDNKRILSRASEALLINSRRNISLVLYREWIIRFIMRLTSAWNSNFSPPVFNFAATSASKSKSAAAWKFNGSSAAATVAVAIRPTNTSGRATTSRHRRSLLFRINSSMWRRKKKTVAVRYRSPWKLFVSRKYYNFFVSCSNFIAPDKPIYLASR